MRKVGPGSRRLAATLGFFVILGVFDTAGAVAPTTPVLLSVTPSTLTPYNSGGCYAIRDCHQVKGNTDAGVKVTLIVRDTLGESITTSAWSAERDDPWMGVAAGDFTFAPNVSGLGTHDTTPSQLTYTAYAQDASANKSPESNPIVVTKMAATAGDVNPPTVTISGARLPGMICGTGYCSFSFCLLQTVLGQRGACTGTYSMAGSSEDLNSTSYGVASEIKSILLTTKNSAGIIVEQVEGLGTRRGTQGFWKAPVTVARYEIGQSYTWRLVGTDAAGNSATAASGTFTRYPA